MRILVKGEMQHASHVENEVGILQDLEILDYLAIDRAVGQYWETKTFSAPRGKM